MTQQVPFLNQNALTKLHDVFDSLFASEFHTILEGGGAEPLYQPADGRRAAKIIYTRDYFSSALHEIAHWCVAGETRRRQTDYGYWYVPDGRSVEQQRAFEQVEIKPQALEWIFSRATGVQFRVSADNLTAECGASAAFKQNIVNQARRYAEWGLPDRAGRFAASLADAFGYPQYLQAPLYSLENLS